MLERQVRRAFKILRLAKTPTYRRGLLRGVGAAIEHEGALRNLRLGSLIDVGANLGQFSLLARALHPRLTIHAFEPLPTIAQRYERLFTGDPEVQLHRYAAGNEAGWAKIHVSARPDSSSLLPISARQNEIFPGTAEASIIKIQVVRVDDVLANIDLPDPILLKLDVQGFELAALEGMPRLLKRVAYIYAELSFLELYKGQPLAHEVIAWLAERGFRITGVHNVVEAENGAAVQSDFLFTQTRD